MSRRVLIVEDDGVTGSRLKTSFEAAGFSALLISDGRDALFNASDSSFDLIILDRMIPSFDGLAVLRAIRAAHIETPTILLSALNAIEERVRGLEAGADDYVVKPFAFSELLARAHVLFRRRTSGREPETRLSCGDLVMDLLAHDVTRAGRRLDMRAREFRLLEYFLRHQNQLITRAMLLEGVWGQRFDPGTNVIEVHVSNLRQQIDRGFGKPLLHTIRGAGYMLSDQR